MTFQIQHDIIPKGRATHSHSWSTLQMCFIFQKDLWCLHCDASWSLGFLQKMLVIHFHTCDIMDPRTPCLLHAYIDRVNGLWGAVPRICLTEIHRLSMHHDANTRDVFRKKNPNMWDALVDHVGVSFPGSCHVEFGMSSHMAHTYIIIGAPIHGHEEG